MKSYSYSTNLAHIMLQRLPNGSLVKNGPRMLLVTEQSACQIGTTDNSHQWLPLDRDHSGLVKFNHQHDEDYYTVRNRLSELVNAALPVVKDRFNVTKG